MAVPTNFGANGLTGPGGGTSGVKGQGLYDVDTVENGPIGAQLFDTSDGSEYVYAYFAGACGPGLIAAIDSSVSIQTSFNAAFVDSGGTAKDTYAAGDTLIFLQSSDITSDDLVNTFAGGNLLITDDTGEGHKYKIRSHKAGGTTETNTIGLEIYAPGLEIAIVSEASASIVGHPYNHLTVANNGTDDVIRGVTLVDVAAGEYAWIQKKGPGIVLADESAGTIAAGTIAVLSDSVNGAAEPLNTAAVNSEADTPALNFAEPQVGKFMTVAVDTEYVPIILNIV
jgi:hypothetical protein